MKWNEIINDFKNGYSVSKLSEKYNISYYKINNYLIKNNLKIVQHTKLSNQKIEDIVCMINSGHSLIEIAEKLHTDKNTIKNISIENKLKITRGKIQRDLKNQNFVDNYFENIDTEEKAYFLGLIYSDGNVREHNGGYFLNLELKREDRYILEKLASELKCGNKIYDRNRKTNFGESCTSSFTTCNSKKMFDDLSKFNIVPNKSHTTESFCDNIEELIPFHLIKHFLRGLIDGDGTISKRYTTNQNAISIYQNEIQFCYDFNRLLKIAIDDENLHENIIINKVSGVYNLRYRRINDVCKICNFLYKDATIYLKRKYNLAKLYFENNQENQQSDSLLLCSNE